MGAEGSAYETVPRAGVDSSLSLAREGYTFISSRCDRLGTDIFWTRLAGRRVFCLRGARAVDLFYSGDPALTRVGAVPKSTQHLLQDEGSAQVLEAEAHRVRKALFLPLLHDDSRAVFAEELRAAWDHQRRQWRAGTRVNLYAALNDVLTECALRFAGLPSRDIKVWARELSAMVDNAGRLGPRNWAARALRKRSERRAATELARVRAGESATPQDRMVHRIAQHTEDGALLDLEVAAVELINVLRPIVATSRFLVFAALAREQHPGWAVDLRDQPELEQAFAQEVRRYYPFFPMIGARTTAPLRWQQHTFAANSWLLLDLYGTNHDPSLWNKPFSFRPERFLDEPSASSSVVAQGGGDYGTSHRCPGEWLTVDAITHVHRFLNDLPYSVPAQDLTVPLRPMPTLPVRGMTITVR